MGWRAQDARLCIFLATSIKRRCFTSATSLQRHHSRRPGVGRTEYRHRAESGPATDDTNGGALVGGSQHGLETSNNLLPKRAEVCDCIPGAAGYRGAVGTGVAVGTSARMGPAPGHARRGAWGRESLSTSSTVYRNAMTMRRGQPPDQGRCQQEVGGEWAMVVLQG